MEECIFIILAQGPCFLSNIFSSTIFFLRCPFIYGKRSTPVSANNMCDFLYQQLSDMIKEYVNPNFILLFGSFAKGTAHDESDIDLAYFSK